MNPDTFFDNFGMLADVPDGVSKLRELILQLAVQGKLVPQDENDEPATELLEKIKAEKIKAVKNGKIKKSKKLPLISEDEKLFDVPICWEWSHLNDLGIIFNGNSLNSQEKITYSKVKNGLPYIATKDVGYGSLDVKYDNGIKIPFEEEKLKIAHANSILICSEGGSAGRKIALINRDICFGNKLLANETFSGVLPKYVFYLYQSRFFKSSFREQMTGIIGGISLFKFLSLVVPLPPFEEQKRIIARVDQLFTLCDELETRQKNKHEARTRLNSAALDKLTSAPDGFMKNWQNISDNFDLLYDAPETVGELRKTILQLAIMGKLVVQDENDEHASVLLEKIKAEKEKLVKSGIIKKEKILPPIKRDELHYEIPEGWRWGRMQDIFIGITDGDHQPPPKTDSGIPFLVIGNVRNGFLDFNATRFVSDKYFSSINEIRIPRKGDILYTVVGSYGIPVVVNTDKRFCIQRHIAILKPSILVNIVFLYNLLKSQLVFNQATEIATGIAQKTVPLMGLRSIIVPIPPIKEQKRIATKVDQLMTLCDELEAKLARQQKDGAGLMDAMVGEMVTG